MMGLMVVLTGCDQITGKLTEAIELKAKAKTPEVDEADAFRTFRELLVGQGTNEVIHAFGKPQSVFETGQQSVWVFQRWRVVFDAKMQVLDLERDVASLGGRIPAPPGAAALAAGTPVLPAATPTPTPAAESELLPATNIIKVSNGGAEVDLGALLSPGKVTIVDFYADWCGPCRSIAPHLERWARSSPDVVLIKVDIVRWGTPVTRQHNIDSVPNLRVFDRQGRAIGSPTHSLTQVHGYLKQAGL
jgi:thiol-disulfide isomerase/thioredoxin